MPTVEELEERIAELEVALEQSEMRYRAVVTRPWQASASRTLKRI